jgi:Domain of unknown function (DUF4382)
MFRKSLVVCVVLLVAGFMLQGCSGGSGSGATPMGSAQISLTDAPGDFDHVWITVKEVRFHSSDAAGPNDPGWLTYPLATPVTVDLLTLNGTVGGAIWGNITLPAGNYQQIRLLLAGSDAALAPSASSLGLTYNDEVVAGPVVSPLRIPDVSHGIRLNGFFSISAGGTLRLAIDFDAGHDVVGLADGEYVLKPRLAYFDLDNVGAIVGRIDLGSAPTGTAHLVVKAERLNDPVSPAYYVVKRYTIVSIPSTTTIGTFVLYPVPAVTTTNYDILIRGVGYETTIIRGVPVTRGSTPMNNATAVPVISMTTGTDYSASGSIASPTGAWVNFYQTLDPSITGTTLEYPYEVRYRHFHPLTGTFANYELSKSGMRFGAYNSSVISLQSVTPQEGVGAYQAAADALLYDRSALPGTPNITSSASTVAFGALASKSGTVSTITGTIDMSNYIPHVNVGLLTRGYVFAVHGGMIVNSVDVGSAMSGGGGPYTIPDLASGFGGAFYGVEAIGWDPGSPMTIRAIAFPPGFVNLTSGSNAAGVTMNMYLF